MDGCRFAIVIFVSRETLERALRTIRDTTRAAIDGTSIEVLVNGNPDLSDALKASFADLPVPIQGRLRLWNIERGDKANALNQYCHAIWQSEELVWLVDGYVSPAENAFRSMHVTLMEHQQALGVSAVPSMGRAAARLRREMVRESGFHGNLCGVRGEVLRRLRDEGVHLPVGTYWVDGLLGSLLHFNLDPSRYSRDLARVVVDGNATWRIAADRQLPRRAATWVKRLRRQSKGKIENAALQRFLHENRQSPTRFPETINTLVEGWAKERPWSVLRVLNLHPVRWLAYRDLHKARSLQATPKEPVCSVICLEPGSEERAMPKGPADRTSRLAH